MLIVSPEEILLRSVPEANKLVSDACLTAATQEIHLV